MLNKTHDSRTGTTSWTSFATKYIYITGTFEKSTTTETWYKNLNQDHYHPN